MNERSGGRARGRALRDQWLTTTAMATGLTVLAMLPNPALANCAATDSIIACSGTTASPGYGDGTQSGQTITVEAGATVLGGSAKTNAAMEIGADNTVNNGGSITGAIHGITATGNILVNNTAVIAANGGNAVDSAGDATVNTTGVLSGFFGVNAVGAATVVNSGTISGSTGRTFEGIKGASVNLVNSGTISTAYAGVDAGAGGATVINQGSIKVTESASAAITSSGGLALDNSGNITGSVSTLVGDASIANKGVIDGVGNIGIYTAGQLTLNNNAGGLISSAGKGISTIGADSILLINAGAIKTTGVGGEAVTAYTDLSGTNNGTISATNDGIGVHAFRDMSLTNLGTISTGNTTSSKTQATAVQADNVLVLVNRGIITTGTSGANVAIQAGAAANVTNESKIISAGADSYGIYSGGDVTLNNSGTLTVTGAGSTGVYAGGSSNIRNTGTIAADDVGIYTQYLGTLTNTSKITSGRVGIISDNDLAVTNSGTILAPTGLLAGGLATVNNSGTIGSGGTGSSGVTADRAVDISNSGTITGETGISVTTGGAGSKITNSGKIIGTGGTAIQLTAAADTLTLKQSSQVQGVIAMGGGPDTINIETSKSTGSQVLVFDTLTDAKVNVTGSRAAQVVGDSIVIIDTTNFIVSDSALMEVTGAASNLVQRRAGNSTSNKPADTTRGFWIQGLGGVRKQEASSSLNGWRHTFGGLMAGYETAPFADYRIGAFAGAAFGSTRVSNSSDSASGTYAFGGLYGRYQPGAAFVDFNIVAGYVANSTKRTVTSNIAAGGVESASNRANGVYISPQVGVGYRVQYDQSGTITPSVKVRYLAAQYGANGESGTTAPINLAARSNHQIEARGDLELSRTRRSANGTSLRMYETIGIVTQTRLTNGVMNASILGTQISLTTPGPRTTVSAAFGAGVEWTSARGATLFANFEAEVRLDKSIAGNARAGAMWTF